MTGPSARITPPPKSWKEKIRWLGPGFLWMVSAAGSGELLFTPRIGALYGYTLLWAVFFAVILKWFINREIGRYTVCTGTSVIDGFAKLPGPRNWALYVILIPQVFVAITTIAGLAGSAATALVLALPGDIRLWTIASVLLSTTLVLIGKFKGVERVATVLAITLGLSAVVAACTVLDEPARLGEGLQFKIPENAMYSEILPWLGFMLSGAAGMIWYSFWIREKQYGVVSEPDSPATLTQTDKQKLRLWLHQLTADNSVAVIGTLLITLSFLILGTELLKPNGLVPEEEKVAQVLGKLLGDLWGPVGFWFMITAVFVGFWDTVLSDQDGFGRMFSGGAKRIFITFGADTTVFSERNLTKWFVIGLLTVFPIALYLWMGEPVKLLKVAGAIEACHIPFLTALILYLNQKYLPGELKAKPATFIMTALAGIFFAAFAAIYIYQIST